MSMIPLGDRGFRCSICGHELPDLWLLPAFAAQLTCPKGCTDGGPPLWKRAANFASAVFHQAPLMADAVLSGDESKAFRSKEEIESIAAICGSCPLFNGEICTHPSCGCPVSADRAEFWSKLAWKSQKCPDGKWS